MSIMIGAPVIAVHGREGNRARKDIPFGHVVLHMAGVVLWSGVGCLIISFFLDDPPILGEIGQATTSVITKVKLPTN